MIEPLTNNNAAGEIRQARMEGLSTNRLCFETGIALERINAGMRDQDFSLSELMRITTCLKSHYRELKALQKRAC